MRPTLHFFGNKIAVLLLLISSGLYAQLPDFTIQATPVAQTCLGNGSINFTVTGNNPAAAMAYEVFLLPNTTIPVAAVSTLNAGNLVAGDYLIVATQTIGSQSNTATVNVTIPDETVPLAYTVLPGAACNGNGSLIVNVTSGTAVFYEIMSGPATFPQQASNTFSNLAPGQYTVRVYDNCGDAVVQTVQVFHQDPADLDFFEVGGSVGLASCNTVNVRNEFVAINGNAIAWPLTFEYSVYPPGGGATQIITSVVPILNSEGGIYRITTEIPFWYDQEYHYDLKVTDACGNIFTINDNIVNGAQNFVIDTGYDPCLPNSLYVNLYAYFIYPVTVTFLNPPSGFDPLACNPSHPVFNQGEEIAYTLAEGNIPFGEYAIKITDACGRSVTRSVIVGPNVGIAVDPISFICNGLIDIYMNGKAAEIVEMTVAPEAYTVALPQDLSGFPGTISTYEITDLPPGDYTIHVIDECGNEYFKTVTIDTIAPAHDIYQAPGCTEDYGSVMIQLNSGVFDTFQITSAPAGFSGTLPFDVSDNASNSTFTMNTLPEGNYAFAYTLVGCDVPFTMVGAVTGYHTIYNEVTVIPNCGSFNLRLRQVANNNFVQTLWLQKYDEATGTWGHPSTAISYIDGNLLTENNSLPLSFTAINYNLAYTGQFRVLRAFDVFGNGTDLSTCFTVVKEFTVEDGPQILNAYSFPCSDGTAEVLIEAEGLSPLSYSITQKDGQPFNVNNGASAFFHHLEPAVYNFMVTDICGNLRNIIFDINTLEPMEIEPLGFCEGQDSSLTVPDFPFLVYQWYKQGSPGTILSTTNELLFPAFDPDTDAGTYAVHIEATTPGSCIDLTVQYEVIPNNLPNAGNDDSISMCGGSGIINLEDYLGTHDAGGTWEAVNAGGSLSGSMLDTSGLSQGTYQFKYAVISGCGIEDTAVITLQVKASPATPVISPIAPVCEGTNVQLSATAVPGAVYVWTGPAGFASAEQNPLIANAVAANAGSYSLTVTVNGCPSAPATVLVNINQAPEFTIDGNAAICAGQSTVLSVVPGNFTAGSVAYKWYKDGVLQAAVTDSNVEIFEPGIYKVEVDNNGCLSSEEIGVTINENAFAVLPEAGCLNEDYIIGIANSDTMPRTSFSWTGPQGFSASGATANISGLPGGDYHVTAVNAEGCTAQATIAVDNTLCGIPRGISPNDDQYNQSFDLSNLDTKKLIIFNRYGLKVYERENYKNEWHGQSDKGELPTGTYYYVVTLSKGKEVTGWVYLQREIN